MPHDVETFKCLLTPTWSLCFWNQYHYHGRTCIFQRVHKFLMIFAKCYQTLYSFIASQITKQPLNLSQLLKVWETVNNTNTFKLTMNKVVIFLPPFRAIKLTLTVFLERQKQILKDPMSTFGDLVQFTQCIPRHGGIASIIPRIRPLMVNKIIIIIRKAAISMDIITLIEVKDVDRGRDMVHIMLLDFPFQVLHYISNKLLQMFLQTHCPQ